MYEMEMESVSILRSIWDIFTGPSLRSLSLSPPMQWCLKGERSKVGQIVIVDVDSSDRGWPQPHSALLLLDTLNRFSS